MNRLRTTQVVNGRSFTRVKDPRLKEAKEQTKHYVDLTPYIVEEYVDQYSGLQADIKVQVGQTILR